ncbi:MAG: site-specific DNA-methyltransferase [Dehalococcoidia bacterium]|nr:site-specific DNA-methyltransferase [Dehalococcoidia bacterium]
MNEQVDTLFLGDSIELLRSLPDNSVDFVITSPPYADNRKSTYQGVSMDQYVQWFTPYTAEILRVLKTDGSFVLNIKERAENGERQTYVIELILEMKRQGWYWIEEYIWHKKNCYPGKWPNRFRDAWERCLHFAKAKKFRMFQDDVMVPVGNWADSRLRHLSDTDQARDESRVGSGFGKNVSNWLDRDFVYPTNVLYMATESSNRGHSASFPIGLPTWFIKLFTRPGDLVLDPFIGSGTTAVAAIRLGRHYLGAELNHEYYQLADEAISVAQPAIEDLTITSRSVVQRFV